MIGQQNIDAKKKGMKLNEIQQLIRIAFVKCPCTNINKNYDCFWPDSWKWFQNLINEEMVNTKKNSFETKNSGKEIEDKHTFATFTWSN